MRDLLIACLTSLLGWGAMGVERGDACWGEVCWGGVGICTGEEVGEVMRSLMRRRASWMSSRVGLMTGFEDRQRSMRSCKPTSLSCDYNRAWPHVTLLNIYFVSTAVTQNRPKFVTDAACGLHVLLYVLRCHGV